MPVVAGSHDEALPPPPLGNQVPAAPQQQARLPSQRWNVLCLAISYALYVGLLSGNLEISSLACAELLPAGQAGPDFVSQGPPRSVPLEALAGA